NFVLNNIVGLNVFGLAPIPNTNGIVIQSSDGNIIGGSEFSEANFIGGNLEVGIVVTNLSKNNKIIGNYLGFNPNDSENASLGNRADGISLEGGATGNFIGTAVAGEGNLIGHSQEFVDSAGIYVAPDSGIDNSILGNSVGVFQFGEGQE
ncbi:MAG TPA: hypothetical protein PKE69_14525, partial [Pyrinomonadaceae bacterium]|nr:hypothetical protein [Pyrinomonadaceae bacterium]